MSTLLTQSSKYTMKTVDLYMAQVIEAVQLLVAEAVRVMLQ